MNSKNFQKAYKLFCKTVKDFELIPEERNKVIIFYSGGKDASLLADLFMEYKKTSRPDLEIDLLTVSFPEMVYNSNDPQQKKYVKEAIEYWEKRGCKHKMVGLPEGSGDHLFDNKDVPCEVCESEKTKIIFDELSKDEYRDSLICMAHTVEDICGYFSELFYLTGTYDNWMEVEKINPLLFTRAMELSKRVYPKYNPTAFGTNIIYIKPLIEFEEDFIRAIRDERDYPDIPECCTKIRGEKFKMYKRIGMEGFDWLRNRYKNTPDIYNNMLFKNYRSMVAKHQKMGLIPSVKQIEDMKLKSGI